ncbi:MAG TPA: methylenetetrahydrofolate reductase C-terminal domain-containing protein, partial [Chloroflexota bacterium]|nr:methylenetetrahydrofolate reductase C-terminal domain-containing protein [Chloroflexota bacterium]
WVSPELLQIITEESRAPDGGRAARLERAAKTVAVLRGLGYAGAYIGGTHDPGEIRTIIRRSEQRTPRWTDLAEELHYGDPRGFYLYDQPAGESDSVGRAHELVPLLLKTGSRLFPANQDTSLRRTLSAASAWADRHPAVSQGLERLEMAVKEPLFGCQACGNCVLSYTEYVCPQTCPKQLRNGPCGGTFNGRCEVVDKQCVWVTAYERARDNGRLEDLKRFVPAPDRSLTGTSSWINYFLERDRRPRADHHDPTDLKRGAPTHPGLPDAAEHDAIASASDGHNGQRAH